MESLAELRKVVFAGVAGQVAQATLVVLVAWLLYRILGRTVRSLAGRSAARATSEEGRQRAEMVFIVIDGVVKGAIVCAAGLALLWQFGGPIALLGSPILGRVVGTAVIAWIAWQLARRGADVALTRAEGSIERETHRQRVKTLLLLIRNIAKYAIMFVAGVTILDAVGLDLTTLLAGVGILGLAVGFGSQNLVRDVVTGFFIIMEGQYAVGDSVEINGLFGTVEQVGLRITKIRDATGQLRFISNGSISRANNYTAKHVAHMVNVPFAADGPDEPIPLVRSLLDDFDRELRVFAEAPVVGPVEELPTYARVVKAETRSIPGRQSLVESKLPARLKAGLERAGHSLPAGTEVSIALTHPAPDTMG